MLCTDLTFVKGAAPHIYAEPIRCKRWSCDHCQPWRKRRLIAKGGSGKPDTFLTLTASPETADTPAAAAKVLVVAFRKVRREAMKRYGYKSLPFIAVFEATKKGQPHLHILLRCPWLDQAWLSDRMAHHARAPIVYIMRVTKAQDIVRYLFKYIGKAPHQFGSCKRYWASRDYDLIDNRPDDDSRVPSEQCETIRRNFNDYLRAKFLEGYQPVFTEKGVWLTLDRSAAPLLGRRRS